MPKEKDELLNEKHYTDSKNKVDLIKRLTSLSNFLKDKDQDDAVAKTLRGVAQALVSPTVIGSKDKDVRLLVACALADIIRLFAPEAPYTDVELKKIFSLFIEQLRGLEKPRDAAYTKVFYLLEKLAVVKAFILLVELDDELLVDLFRLFFTAVSVDHSPKAVSYMKDVMCACLDEASTISQALLDSVLSHLLPPTQPGADTDLPGRKLAQSVVVQSASRFQNPVLQFLSEVISGAQSTESEVKDRAHDIIYELYRVAPVTVVDVLPQLEGELKVDDVNIRRTAIDLLGRVFSEKAAGPLSTTVKVQLLPLLHAFAQRLFDKQDELRLLTLRHLRAILLAHPDLMNDEELQKNLLSRLHDPNEQVRREALPTLCDLAAAAPERLSEQHIRECIERLRDKKPVVRVEAIQQLAKLYGALDRRFGDEPWPPGVESRYGALPAKLLQNYALEEPAGRYALETALDEHVLPAGVSASAELRAAALVRAVRRLDHEAVLGFQRLLADKKRVQTDFLALLELRKSKVEAADEATQKMGQIAARLPVPLEKCVSALAHLDFRQEPVLLRALQQLARAELRFTDSQQAKTNALYSSKDNEVYQKLIQRLSGTLLNIDYIVPLLRAAAAAVAQSVSAADSQRSLEDLALTQSRLSLLFFIQCASAVYPALFRAQTVLLRDWVRGADVELIECALVVFARAGTYLDMGSHAADLKKQFVGFAAEGTARQAKYAVRALVAIDAQHSDENLRVLLKKLGGNSLAGVENVPANLSARTQLAAAAPHLFRTVADACTDFVKELLLRSDAAVATKVLGLKLLVRGSARLQSADLARLVQRLLLGLLRADGEPTAEKRTADEGRRVLRKYALSGFLALARHFDAYVSPADFLQLVLAANDKAEEVREHVLTKLSKYSLVPSMPLSVRYFSIFAWFGTERHRATIVKARTLFENAVRGRRELIRTVSAVAPLDPRHSAALLPEYALPSLVYVLAYRPEFADDREQQSLRGTAAYLHYFLVHIQSNDNLVFVDQLLRYIKSAENANPKLDPVAFRVVCDVALKIHHHRADHRKWTSDQVQHTQIYLPQAFYRVIPQKEIKEESNYLPPGWQLSLRRQSVRGAAGEELSEASNASNKTSPPKRISAVSGTPKRAGAAKQRVKAAKKEEEEEEAVESESESESEGEQHQQQRMSTKKEPLTVNRDSEAAPAAAAAARPSPSRARARAVAAAIRTDGAAATKQKKAAEEEKEEEEENAGEEEPAAVHQRKKKKN